MTRTLTHRQARRVYDRIGRLQDSQHFYEDPPLAGMIAHGAFDSARAVCELGCGTGRLAERLLRDHLPAGATYLGIDVSPVMVRLAGERLAAFGPRARVEPTDGAPPAPAGDGSCDRFVATYVLDLLSEADIRAWLDEAHRLLRPGGRLCVAGLTRGRRPLSRVVMGVWRAAHAVRPQWVGGCRPLELVPLLDAARWRLLHRGVLEPWGVPSEVVVAERLSAEAAA